MTKFILPSRPKLKYVEKKADNRKYAIIPIRAGLDTSLTRAQLRVLIQIASYSNRNGYSLVALSTMAKDRGISAQSISRQVQALEKKGYIQTVRKGYTNLRGALRRILFEPNITENEQVAISNDNTVEVYDMAKHIQKRSKAVKQSGGDDSLLSYDEAVLVVSHSLKSESDLLTLERLVSQGVTRTQLLERFGEGA